MSDSPLGITGVGAHVPRYRLSGETLDAVWGGSARGMRVVANHDEDSLTMAAAAALAAIGDDGGSSLDLLCFASTTAPYAEKSSAALLAAVLDCDAPVSIVDLEAASGPAPRGFGSRSTPCERALHARRWWLPRTCVWRRLGAISSRSGVTERLRCGWGREVA